VLLACSTKTRQQRDIATAHTRWADYRNAVQEPDAYGLIEVGPGSQCGNITQDKQQMCGNRFSASHAWPPPDDQSWPRVAPTLPFSTSSSRSATEGWSQLARKLHLLRIECT
jgi:hypothetical protein